LAYAPKPKIPPPPKKEDPAKDSVCHHYSDTGHWKRNCPLYLSELLKNKKLPQEASTSGYPKETMVYSFYYPPKNKVFIAWNIEFFKNSLTTQEASGSLKDLKLIQEDTHPSENTSSHHDDCDHEIDEPQ
nr:zinc finger, CCHC-type [Tanacetum cinerariifolium]